MAATRLPSTSARPWPARSGRPRSYSSHSQDDSDSGTTASESGDLRDQPDVHELRRVRAQVFSQSGRERKEETNRKMMAAHTARGKHSDSRAYGAKAPSITVREVREVRRKPSSGRRHHRHSVESSDEDDDDSEEIHYVQRSHRSGKKADRDPPSIIRRTTTTSDASRSRPRRDDEHLRNLPSHRVPLRKYSERRSIYRDEQVYDTVRRDKRSTAENRIPQKAVEQRNSTPVKRTASTNNASSVSILRPLLFRSNTVIQNSNRNSYAAPVTPRVDENRERRPSSSRPERAGDRSSGIFSSIFGLSPAPPRKDESIERRPSSTRAGKAGDRSSGIFTPLRPPAPVVSRTDRSTERRPSSAKPGKAGDRSSGVFGAFMGPSKPTRKPESPKKPEPVRKAEPPKRQMTERRVECVTCLSDDILVSRAVKLKCNHRMCFSCLRRIFNLSVTDPQHMPPTCCTADVIPLKHVDRLFDNKFKNLWNRKYQEYTTKNRIYCPARKCGEWIKPANIHTDTSGGTNHGRKYGKCQRCGTKVCCLCNNRWHTSRECPKDAETQEFIRIAKKEGWQRCYNCKATVELKEGCNHMTCRCRAEFCMICGLQWKTCDCPWFNYEAVEADRLNHMNIPVPVAQRVHNLNPARGYQEELDRRREQELGDEAIARRIQVLGLDGEPDHLFNAAEEGFGNAAPNFLNNDFLNRAANILYGTYDPAQADAAERLVAEHNNNNYNNNNNQNQNRAPPPPPPPPRPQLPPQHQPQPQILRRPTTASRTYNARPTTRPSERVVPRREEHLNYAAEAERHRPLPIPIHPAVQPRTSQLAGITRAGTGSGRVDEWRRHVDVGGGNWG